MCFRFDLGDTSEVHYVKIARDLNVWLKIDKIERKKPVQIKHLYLWVLKIKADQMNS